MRERTDGSIRGPNVEFKEQFDEPAGFPSGGYCNDLAFLSASAADPAAGQSKAQSCVACHGADGNSSNGGFPSLAGQVPATLPLS